MGARLPASAETCKLRVQKAPAVSVSPCHGGAARVPDAARSCPAGETHEKGGRGISYNKGLKAE